MLRARRLSTTKRHPAKKSLKRQITRDTPTLSTLSSPIILSTRHLRTTVRHVPTQSKTIRCESQSTVATRRRSFSVAPVPSEPAPASSAPPPPPPPPQDTPYHDSIGIDVGLSHVRCAIYKGDKVVPVPLGDKPDYPAVVAISKLGVIKAGHDALQEEDNSDLYRLTSGFKYAIGDVPQEIINKFNDSPYNKYKSVITRDTRTEKEIYFPDEKDTAKTTTAAPSSRRKPGRGGGAADDNTDTPPPKIDEARAQEDAEIMLTTPLYRAFDKTYPTDALLKVIYSDCKKSAEAFTNTRLTKGCATVPTEYSPLQRLKISQALTAAGLTAPLVVNESVAAGYGILKHFESQHDGYFFVFDFGMQTRVHLYHVKDNVMSVIRAYHDLQKFSTDEFDQALLVTFASQIGQSYFLDVTTDPQAKDFLLKSIRQMRNQFQHAKNDPVTLTFPYRKPSSIAFKYQAEHKYYEEQGEILKARFYELRDLKDNHSPNSQVYRDYEAQINQCKKDNDANKLAMRKLDEQFLVDMNLKNFSDIPEALKRHTIHRGVSIDPIIITHTFVADEFNDLLTSLMRQVIDQFMTHHLSELPPETHIEDGKVYTRAPPVNFCLPIGAGARSYAIRRAFEQYVRPGFEHIIDDINDPAYITAGGAARYGNVAHGRISNVLIGEMALQSIGVLDAGGILNRIVERGTIAPYSKRYFFTRKLNLHDETISLHLFQGDKGNAEDNHYLDEVIIDIPEYYRVKGHARFMVTVESADGQSDITVKIQPQPKKMEPVRTLKHLFDSEKYTELQKAKTVLQANFSQLQSNTYVQHLRQAFDKVADALEIEPVPEVILEQKIDLNPLTMSEYEAILNEEKKYTLRDEKLFHALKVYHQSKSLLSTVREYLKYRAQSAPIYLKLWVMFAAALCRFETRNVEKKIFPFADVEPEDFRIQSMFKAYNHLQRSIKAIETYLMKSPATFETIDEVHPVTGETQTITRRIYLDKPSIIQRCIQLAQSDWPTIKKEFHTSIYLPTQQWIRQTWNYCFPIARSHVNSTLYHARRALIRFRVFRWILSYWYYFLDYRQRVYYRKQRKSLAKKKKKRERDEYSKHVPN